MSDINILAFCKARIAEDKARAYEEERKDKKQQNRVKPLLSISKHYRRQSPRRVVRQSDYLTTVIMSVEEGVVGAPEEEYIDNMVLAPLALMANIWRDHHDFDLQRWFPTLFSEDAVERLEKEVEKWDSTAAH